jgi:nitrite reductase/ring-hydroxylating ferredoxin subunit
MVKVKIALKKEQLVENKPVLVEANGKKLMLVLVAGKPYALEDACSHRGGPLHKGVLTGYTIECPWHGAQYDVRTGAGDPRTSWGPGQAKHDVSIDENGDVWVDVG